MDAEEQQLYSENLPKVAVIRNNGNLHSFPQLAFYLQHDVK